MKKDVLKEFERKHNLTLVTQQAGFGEIVTGFIPINNHMYVTLDKELAKSKPNTAYSHCDILAIKGKGMEAKHELTKWINSINEHDVEIRKIRNENKGMQFKVTGNVDFVLSIVK